MPGKVKVKIIAGKNLPVMDRSSDTTDAYVEIKLGSTTYKTDVCRKSLNPQWNSDWYRFEVDDSELQDEPLQIRLMDHDTYSANDAIGKVYLALNPLLLPSATLLPKFGWGAESSNNNEHVTNSVLSGWFPVYDTMHGIRGEVHVIVKVELFSDFNKFRQSSCGVQFFCSPIIPHGYCVQMYHGFVEELIVNDDPEYQWIDKIRTPRASNEARQTLFFKLAGELQRKIGVKALELGGNAVVGYNQCFDLEGELGIVVRGIGTAVTLIKLRDAPPVALIDTTNEERAQSYLQFLRHDTRFRLNHNNSKPLQPEPYSSTSVLYSQNVSDDPTNYNLKGGRNLTRHLSYSEFCPSSKSVQSLNCPVVHHASSLQTLLRQEDLRGNPGSGISQRLKNFKYSSQNMLAKKMTALKAKLSDSGMPEEDDNSPECSAPVALDGVKNKPLFQRSTSDNSAMAELLVRSLMHTSLDGITETHDNSELTSSPPKTNVKQDTTDNDDNTTVKTDESLKLFKKSLSEPQLVEPDSLLSMELSLSNVDSSTESSSSSDEDESVSDVQDSTTNSEYDTISNIVKNVIHHPDEPMKTLVLDEIDELNRLSESSSLENEMCEMSKHHCGPGKTNIPPLAEAENFDIEDNNSVHFLIGDAEDDNSNIISTDSASYQNLEESTEIQLNPSDCQEKSLIPPIKKSENSMEDQDLIQTTKRTMFLEKLKLVSTFTPPPSPSVTDKDKNIFNLQNSSVLQQDDVPGQSQPKSIVSPVKLKDNTAENQGLMKTAVQTLLLDKLKLVSAYSPPSSPTIASKEDSVIGEYNNKSSQNITPKQPKSILPPLKVNKEDQGLMKTAVQTILLDKLKLVGTYTPPSSPSKVDKENKEFDLEHPNASNQKPDTTSEQFQFKPVTSGTNKEKKVSPLEQSSGLKQKTDNIPKQSRLKSILPPIKVNKNTTKDQGLMQTAMQTILFDKLKLVGTYTPPSSPTVENKDKNIFNIEKSIEKTETKSHQEKPVIPLVKMNETTSENEPQDKLKLVGTYTPLLCSSVAANEQKVYSFEDSGQKTVPDQSPPKMILPPVKVNEGTSKNKNLMTTAMQTILLDKIKLIGAYTPPTSPTLVNTERTVFNKKEVSKTSKDGTILPPIKKNKENVNGKGLMKTAMQTILLDRLKLVGTYTPRTSPSVADMGKNVFDFKNSNVDRQEDESFFTKIACISESVRKNPAPFRRSSTTRSLNDDDFDRPNMFYFTSLDKLYNDNKSITVPQHGDDFVTGDQKLQKNLAKLNIKEEASDGSLNLSPNLTSSNLISTNCNKINDFNESSPVSCLKAIPDNLPVNSELDKGNNNMHASLAHSLRTAGSPGIEPARIDHGHQRTESVGAKISQSPARFHPIPFMHRRSSDSDLSITPKGNSLTGSDKSCGMPSGYFSRVGPLLRPSIPQENFDMLEYPFITMSKYSPGFIIYLGGVVSARSVKLLERITNLEEPESRDMWWTELRMEIRSHARALNCNAVLAYSETSSICDDVCVLSASGTAAVIGWQYTGEIGDSIGGLPVIPKPYYANKDVMASSLDRNDFEREKALQKPESILLANIGLNSKPLPESPENETQPAFVNSLSPCTVCHLPYTGNAVPLRTITLKCAVCRIGKVPEILLATIELPEGTPTMGRGCFIQAYVCRPLKDLRSESNAKDISDGLPFLEYELHRILVNKIRIKGMNAVFGLKVRISIGTKMLVGIATGTGVFLLPLPPPPLPKLVSVRSTDEKQLAEMQQLLSATVETNKEIYQLKTTEDSQNPRTSPENEHSEDEQPFLDMPSENRDCCILEVDDPEDMEIMNLLMEPRPPDGFHVVNTELVPGLEEIEIVRSVQMFTQIWRSKLYPSYNFGRHIHKLLQSVYFKLRRMIPCALCDLQFRIDLPDSDEIQLTVLGMALGLGEPQKSVKHKRKNVHVPLRDSVGKNDEDMIFNLEDDHIEASSIPHQSGSNFLNVQPTKHRTRSPHRTKIPASKQQALSREKHGIDITPLSYIPGGKIERYLGNLNFFFIRETTSIREEGGLSGFLHSFITEVLAIVRAHIAALGGNAMVAYYMTECVLSHSLHKNQGQCLINVGGDVVFVSYFTEE